MNWCSNCGKKLQNDMSFCPFCGTQIEIKKGESSREKFKGQVHKCPSCGEILGPFVVKCPSCGYEVRDCDVVNSVKEFSELVSNALTDEKKAAIICEFPIPNAKEDIIEFSILAATNLKNLRNELLFQAWNTKFEQCYEKAKITFGTDSEFEKVQLLYNQVKQVSAKKKAVSYIANLANAMKKTILLLQPYAFSLSIVIVVLVEIYRINNYEFEFLDLIIDIAVLALFYFVSQRAKEKNKSAHYSNKEVFPKIQDSDGNKFSMTKALSEKLDRIDSEGQYIPEQQLSFIDNLFHREERKEEYKQEKLNAIARQKAECIKNCPLPSTKEDTLDFLMMANTNAMNNNSSELSKAWRSKATQVYNKAQILFEGEPGLTEIEKEYKAGRTPVRRIRYFIKDYPSVSAGIGIIIVLYFLYVGL